MRSRSAALSVENLVVGYGDITIVNGVSLAVEPAEMVTIIGPNGAGKSTLVKAIAGLLRPKAGTVKLTGIDVTHVPSHRRAKSGLAYVPQLNNVFQYLTVRENLRLGVQHLARRERERQVSKALNWFPDLGQLGALHAGELSGGQRQMLTLSRALLLKARVIVVDEPTAGLSPLVAQQVFDTLSRIRDDGTAILVVEQNVDLALTRTDRVFVLSAGESVFKGTPTELLEDCRLVDLYLGDSDG